MFTAKWFFDLEKRLIESGLDSDSMAFSEIKELLQNRTQMNPHQFATQAIYVILAGGFSQKTAKVIHSKIMDALNRTCCSVGLYPKLIALFNNKNKINAVIKIWSDKENITDAYYKLSDLDSKLLYLSSLPHIGKITANHLARNLGENVVKYDIWIQRLGLLHANQSREFRVESLDKVDNKKLNPKIKKYCDDMFCELESQTDLPRGYIDVVLLKAAQNGLIEDIKK